jgi:CO/xanthine dehydrogenase Mo-binding subunit
MVELADKPLIGGRARRLDADDKVTGRARYATDLTFPGLLYGKIVRSDRPHARIVSIDTSAAEALPGVEAVLSGDLYGRRFGEVIKDQTPFAIDRVRYIGDPLAAIAADSSATAEAAAQLIEIEYEDLPAVFDPIEAMLPGAPLVHEDVTSYAAPPVLIRHGNVAAQVLLNRGDVAGAFAQADHVIEGTYSAHSAHQMPMEPRAAVAEVDAHGRLTIHSSTQGPFNVRQQLHEAFGLPYTDLRVIAATVGGGFGSKLEAAVELYAGMLARSTGRPVKVVNSREEDLSYGAPRHPMIIHLRSAVTADGTILGREAMLVMDAGAYAGGSPLLAGVAAMLAPGPYRIPNLKVEVLVAHTNKMAFGAYRGPSGPQTVFAVESHTDAIAKQIGIDALEFRLKNIFVDGDTGHSGQTLSNVGMRDVLTKAAAAIGWGMENPPSAPGLKRGKGLSVAWWPTSAGASACSVQMNEDGTVVVQTGATEIGSGSVAAGIAQIIAGEIGVSLDSIRVVSGDTATTPMDAGAQGSRTLFNAGQAAKRAAKSVRSELFRRAADILEVSEADLEVTNGRITVKGVPDRGIDYADLTAGQMWASEPVLGKGTYVMPPTPNDDTTLQGSLVPAFNAASYHCHAAEVEVDPETGSTRIVDFVVAQDVGFAVTPLYVEGQMQGGAVQGVGYMLTEEVVIEDGRMLNPNLALYKIPTMLDAPDVRPIIVEAASEHGPYGAKGVGEPPVVLPPGAIANAVANAIGNPIRTTPLTPERVLRVIRDGEEAAAPAIDPAFDLRPRGS